MVATGRFRSMDLDQFDGTWNQPARA